jgi:hypothetical protein
MALTMKDVRAALDPEEPRYEESAARLGPEALPLLEEVIREGDPMLASKAVYLAAMIGGGKSAGVLSEVARSGEVVLRVAAAGAARHLGPEHAERILDELVDDDDVGVQKVAVRSIQEVPTKKLLAKVGALAKSHADPSLRDILHEVALSARPPED